jgi:cyclopropane fatty-acyl-phospholipid synthase-like methyltransferase
LAEAGLLRGRVLDVGCGTGEHALLAASLDLDATGIDAAPVAIDLARRKAVDRQLDARFLVWDALDLPALNEQFDTILDCGLFHVFDDGDRCRYVESLGSVIRAEGWFHMLCFSDRQPGDWGPRRVTEDEIRGSFSNGWRVDSVEPTAMDITISPEGALAWLCAVTRL